MTQNKNMIAKAVIFDMDGVLIDSEPFYASRFEKLFTAYNKPYTDEVKKQLAGASSQIEFGIVRRHWDEAVSESELRSMYQQVNTTERPDFNKLIYPEVRDVLDILKDSGMIMALASSSGMLTIKHVLQELDLTKYFVSVISGEMFKLSKPHPEIYLHSLEMLNLDTADCIAVEDSTYGIQSATAAGLRVAAIRDSRFGYDQTPATWLIDSLYELPAILGLQ